MTVRFSLSVLLLSLLMLSMGCATEFPGDPPEEDRFEYPVNMALHPAGGHLYVVSANFDLRYRLQDGGLLSIVDTASGEVMADRSMRIPSFSAEVILNHDARRGYIAGRGSNAIFWFEVSESGDSVSCPLEKAGSSSLEACRVSVPSEPTSMAYRRDERTQQQLDSNGVPLLDANGDPLTETIVFDLLVIAHLSDGVVTAMTVTDPVDGEVVPRFSRASAAVLEGPSDVVNQAGTDRFFLTGRAGTRIIGVRPAIGPDGDVIGVFQDTALSVPTAFTAFEGRNLRFNPSGDRLYVTSQLPDALLVFDFSESDNDEVRGSRNRIVDAFDLPLEPNSIAVIPDGDRELLYISSFDDNSLIVLDPLLPAVVHRSPLGQGPFEIIIGPDQRAYVNNFIEHTISIIDISDPRSPKEVSVVSGASDAAAAQRFREQEIR